MFLRYLAQVWNTADVCEATLMLFLPTHCFFLRSYFSPKIFVMCNTVLILRYLIFLHLIIIVWTVLTFLLTSVKKYYYKIKIKLYMHLHIFSAHKRSYEIGLLA